MIRRGAPSRSMALTAAICRCPRAVRLVHRDRFAHHDRGTNLGAIVVGRAGLSGVHTILKPASATAPSSGRFEARIPACS